MSTVCRGYIRVSTEEQAEEGHSLEAQERSLRDHAAKAGWIMAEIYADEGISAKDMHRPALQRLLADVQRSEILLVWKLDRLSRSVADTETIFQQLDRRDARFASVAEPHLSTTGSGGIMVRQMTAVFAEFYRRQLGENVRHGMSQMARQGKWTGGPLPYGYDLVDGRLVPNSQAAIVREIYASYLRGVGIRTIAAHLNRAGHRTRQNAEWSSSTVSYVLQNPIYTGQIAFGRRFAHGRYHQHAPLATGDGEHAALIDQETFDRAQAVRQQRKRMPARYATGDYPLTGVTVCALCGASVSGTRMTDSTRRPTRTYRCNRRLHRATCNLQLMRADRLESVVLEEIRRLFSPGAVEQLVQARIPAAGDGQVDELRTTLAGIDRELVRWDAAYKVEAIDLQGYKEKAKPLRDLRKGLLEQLRRLEQAGAGPTAEELVARGRMFATLWDAADLAERKALLHALVERVTVYPGYRADVELRRDGALRV